MVCFVMVNYMIFTDFCKRFSAVGCQEKLMLFDITNVIHVVSFFLLKQNCKSIESG